MNSDRRIIKLQSVGSTNDFLREQGHNYTEPMVIAQAGYQSAGRGQGTNRWESAPGKNLLFSLLVHPGSVDVRRQFVLSMAGALAVGDALASYTGGISLKWPNDVYWNDRKISGTLIETTLAGSAIKDCIFGIGINVNQQTFVSDAPNPVSLYQILHRETEIDEVLSRVLDAFAHYYAQVTAGAYGDISRLYHERLYRRDGAYTFRDSEGTFTASISHVEDDGHLVLRDTGGNERRYAFKEINYII